MLSSLQVLIAECADPFLRAMLINFTYVSYSIGILVVYVLGTFLHWRYVAWCGIVLPLISIATLSAVPIESPTWLIRNGYKEQAAKVLYWLRGDPSIANRELQDIQIRYEQEQYDQQLECESIRTACARTEVLKPLILVGVFQMLLLLTGTYLIVFYAVDILSDLGTSVNSMTAAVLTALVRLSMTIVCCFAFYYMQRLSIYVPAGFGSGMTSTLLAIYLLYRYDEPKTNVDIFISFILMLIYIAMNTGFMVAPGFMIGELLPAKIRGRISGYIYAMFNISFFCLAKLFPYFKDTVKIYGVFLLFGAASFLATALIYFMVPETKGRTLGEIEDYFKQSTWLYRSATQNSATKRDQPDAAHEQKATSIKEMEKFLVSKVIEV